MQRTLLLAAALLVTGVAFLAAQETSNDANPLYRGFSIHLGGISVPPIAGAPFSATALIELQQPLTDGTVSTVHNVNLIGRDFRGRTHGEMRPWMPESFRGMRPLREVHISDPLTHTRTIYDPATQIARREVLQEPAKPSNRPTAANPWVKIEDLGSTTLDDIEVKGTRRTLTIPARAKGDAAVTVVDEYWYSEDLHVSMLLRHTDPRTGVETISLSDVKREEPPQSFFEVPAGYKIVDMTPPPNAPVVRGAGTVIPVTP